MRLARANKARIEAQAAALEEQQRRCRRGRSAQRQLGHARATPALVDMARILSSTMDLRRLLATPCIRSSTASSELLRHRLPAPA